jgi:epoxyqueuosine reductase
MTAPADITASVKSLAMAQGFARVGITSAGDVADGPRFTEWLRLGRHASMSYLARNVELRLRPDRLVPGARSVICLAAEYPSAGAEGGAGGGGGLVARYARGRDYHKVLKRRCHGLIDSIRRIEPAFGGKAFVDSGPVLERSLAAAAGVGWIGRNCCLVAPGMGSYLLLCEIVCNLPLRPDGPLAEGGCTGCDACVRACPTGALTGDGLDARRCVSYLTVEHRGAIDPALWAGMGRRLVGCDACQEACPHNRPTPTGGADLRAEHVELPGTVRREPVPFFQAAGLADILRWTAEDWDLATRGSAARRVRFDDMIRNAVIAAGNSGGLDESQSQTADLLSALRALEAGRPELQNLIRCAIGRLGGT